MVAQSQPINVTLNNTNPGIAVGSPSLGNFKYFISVNRIDEVSTSGNIVYSVPVSSVNFTLNTVTNGANKLHNYSAVLKNTATLSVLVSLILFFFFLIVFLISFYKNLIDVIKGISIWRTLFTIIICRRKLHIFSKYTQIINFSFKLAILSIEQHFACEFGFQN